MIFFMATGAFFLNSSTVSALAPVSSSFLRTFFR
jgi:hypothetical protein